PLERKIPIFPFLLQALPAALHIPGLELHHVPNLGDIPCALGPPDGPVLLSPQHWELLVLEKLKWDLVSVIANDFLPHILHRLPLPAGKAELVKKHAQTFIALCATDDTFLMYPPSMVATGSIGAAIHGLSLAPSGLGGDAVTELLAGITGTEVDCLKACQEQIEAALAESLKQASQSQQEFSAKAAAYGGSQPTGTPTDVTDVNL
ncbi:G1/S-specific cyclin-D3, partial [Prinia subflava]|uniref:G1/S-specific cyclin-D3 n=1 Tax=Prinia subflava TaxID=208062 RepID=UPI002FE36F80